ncbi:hypothetical protein FS837_000401, partial [Tulasnella sp. UAMH 9824]
MSFEDYDEFGNYIGADLDSDEEEQEELQQQTFARPQAATHAPLEGFDDDEDARPEDASMMEVDDGPRSTAVILHENKQYYPSASDVYGEDVEAMVQEEDAQPLTEPIIAPVKVRKWAIEEKDLPETRFDKGFMVDLLQHPEMVRNVAVVGHLHHGKTSLLDMLVFETHKLVWEAEKPLRYTDTHPLATQRQISLKSSPLSLVLSTSNHKSLLFHLIDTPGHINFVDEVASAMRLADGIVLVVDVVEGLMSGTEAILRHALLQNVAITLVVNKIDRLILELRIPPADAYYKVKATIEEVNTYISGINPDPELRLSPERGNVAFASSQMGYCFTLGSFAKLYADTYGSLDVDAFALRLWGDIYFDSEDRKFTRKPADPEQKRTFVHFILEPLYKLYSQVLSEDTEALKDTLYGLGIELKPVMYKMDARPLLKAVLDQFFGASTGLVDMVARWVPSPIEGAKSKISRIYTGPMNTEVVEAMERCDPDGPLMIQITKLYHTADAQDFRAFGRIYSGTLKRGMEVKVLGEGYSPEDEEDMVKVVVEDVWISESRNKITMIAEPLERGIAEDIESGRISMKMTPKDRGKIFQEKYQWDLLASRSIWAFGPDERGPNILVDDTLPSQVDKRLVNAVKEHIKQGFQWGTREGPLCDEPIRNVKFRVLDATLAQEPIFRGGGQIVPTARRVCYSSFLMATPRLMEPIYYVEVQAPADCISAVYTVLARRRGHVTQDIPKAGSPLYTIKALIPVIDANGFETDLRTATQGQAFCLQTFDHWSIVP